MLTVGLVKLEFFSIFQRFEIPRGFIFFFQWKFHENRFQC